MSELVRDAQLGNHEAFGELHRRFARFVHGIALAHGSPHDAGDTVRDTFAQALHQLSLLKEPAAFGAWIATMTRTNARQTNRRGPRLVKRREVLTETLAGGRALNGALVMAALRSLPDAYREALILRLVNRMSESQIAECSGMTHGSVRVNLFRGMTLLRQHMRGDGAGDDATRE